MSRPTIVGIDPGLKGYLACLGESGLGLLRMPVQRLPTSKGGTKGRLDAPALSRALLGWNPDLVVIEDVYSSPQMGVVSAFTFGEGKGTLAGVCGALGLRVVWVHPSVWKPVMKVTKDKALCKAAAVRLFPMTRIPTVDAAEASLLALYGMLNAGKLIPG